MCTGFISLAAAALGAFSSVQQGQARARAEELNAQLALRNAAAVAEEQADLQDASAIERRRLGERVAAERGAMLAKFGAMGLDPAFGTPADLIGDLDRAYDLDRDIMGRNEISGLKALDKQATDYRVSAQLGGMAAQSSRTAGSMAAGASLLDGAATVSSDWIMPTTRQSRSGQSSIFSGGGSSRPVLSVGAG